MQLETSLSTPTSNSNSTRLYISPLHNTRQAPRGMNPIGTNGDRYRYTYVCMYVCACKCICRYINIHMNIYICIHDLFAIFRDNEIKKKNLLILVIAALSR
jgi:hypothetical protein